MHTMGRLKQGGVWGPQRQTNLCIYIYIAVSLFFQVVQSVTVLLVIIIIIVVELNSSVLKGQEANSRRQGSRLGD